MPPVRRGAKVEESAVRNEDMTLGCLVESVACALELTQCTAAAMFLRTKDTSYRSAPLLITSASFDIPLAFLSEPEIAKGETMPDIPDVASSTLRVVISAGALERFKPDEICVLRLGFKYAGERFALTSSIFERG